MFFSSGAFYILSDVIFQNRLTFWNKGCHVCRDFRLDVLRQCSKLKGIGGRRNWKRGVGGPPPEKNSNLRWLNPWNLILTVYLTAQGTVEDCSQLGWYLLPSWLWRWKTRLGFPISRFTCRLRLTSLLKLCLRFLQAPAHRKVAKSSWMLKTVQS